MGPMKSVASRTYEREPWPHDCMMHALDEIDQAMCGQLDKMPWACVHLLDGTFIGSHELEDTSLAQSGTSFPVRVFDTRSN